ncbi:hypothetical protein KM043_005182 [Ampulex compressa]|nr:hypothetical protein KM043_005182 [Ampulex compressa]
MARRSSWFRPKVHYYIDNYIWKRRVLQVQLVETFLRTTVHVHSGNFSPVTNRSPVEALVRELHSLLGEWAGPSGRKVLVHFIFCQQTTVDDRKRWPAQSSDNAYICQESIDEHFSRGPARGFKGHTPSYPLQSTSRSCVKGCEGAPWKNAGNSPQPPLAAPMRTSNNDALVFAALRMRRASMEKKQTQ